MRYLLLLVLALALTGCSSEIESRHVKAAHMLCSEHQDIKEIEIDPVGNDLYICNDGAQYVVGYTNADDGTYYITHNQTNKKRNEMLDRIMMPKKWEEKDKPKPKEAEK